MKALLLRSWSPRCRRPVTGVPEVTLLCSLNRPVSGPALPCHPSCHPLHVSPHAGVAGRPGGSARRQPDTELTRLCNTLPGNSMRPFATPKHAVQRDCGRARTPPCLAVLGTPRGAPHFASACRHHPCLWPLPPIYPLPPCETTITTTHIAPPTAHFAAAASCNPPPPSFFTTCTLPVLTPPRIPASLPLPHHSSDQQCRT